MWSTSGGYATALAKLANELVTTEGEAMIRVALAAGHYNHTGGNPVEKAITGPLTRHYAQQLRSLGMDVRVITPEQGDFPGSVTDVGQQVVTWANQGWVADLLLETHTEGVANPQVRGAFGVYPDWGDDVDLDAQRLGQAIARAISAATSITVRGDGSLSERKTAVGLAGSRLGLFRITEPLKASTTRLIMEHGAHSNPDELALLNDDAKRATIAAAAAKAILGHFLGMATPPAADNDLLAYFPETGITMRKDFGFYQYWANNGGVDVFGFPISGEMTEDGKTVQYFERARLECLPDGKIMRGLVGKEAYQARYGGGP
jgi:N-acetylmuramoyl-L-alanine amidase